MNRRYRLPLVVIIALLLGACGRSNPPSQASGGSAGASGGPGGGAQAPSGICPTASPVAPGDGAQAAAVAAAEAAVPTMYPSPSYDTAGVSVTASYPAQDNGSGYAGIPFGMCGAAVGQDTWVVELHFPAMEAQGPDLANGQLFVARFGDGWKAWFQYH